MPDADDDDDAEVEGQVDPCGSAQVLKKLEELREHECLARVDSMSGRGAAGHGACKGHACGTRIAWTYPEPVTDRSPCATHRLLERAHRHSR